ncbi:MAG TPA: endonuclease MutS2 [Candidatus Dormibacteraeota bacterium]|nr:endonuclease MutS2 [Candidatus Dormibacteraeota bacterium]
MRPRDLSALDFPRVTARVADFAASSAGQERCRALAPTADRRAADAALERAWQLHLLLERHGDPPLPAFADVRPQLRSAAHEGFVLDGKALVAVRDTLAAIRAVGAFFRRHAEAAPALAGLPERLVAFPSLEAELGRALDDEGNVLDAASPALARVRASIRRLRDGLQRKLEELVARRGLAEVISDDYVTLRNNRFVVPVRAGAVGQLPGVVQDRSVSGETLFVEPLFAVEMNNELLLAVREEELIVQRILTDLTGLAGAEHAAITASIDALVEVDCLVAAARFARTYRCTRPSFSDLTIELRAARHPGLLFTGRPVTPIDVLLPADRRVLVVTGPNTGGKTVALKTLGLCALMAQSGLLIPAAEGARLPCFAAIFADVGDEQSIERNLSTFSAHVANLCEIAAAGVGGALVLLDEPGVGTDPEEGAALAVGLLRWFDAHGAHLALTTHYTPLKLLALDDPRCAVAAVDVDVESLTPRYRLVYDSIGRSLALPIARRLGLPAAILDTAAGVQPEHARLLNAALERLERTRAALEARLGEAAAQARIQAENATESTRLLGELRERRRSAWQEEVREARAFLRQLKAEGRAQLEGLRGVAEARAALDRFTREQEAAIAAREQVEDVAPAAPASAPPAVAGRVAVGDTVAVGDRGIEGELLAVDGARAWIQRGTMRFEVPAAQLRRVAPATAPRTSVVLTPASEESGLGELNVIGLRAREALDRLEGFLDRAVRAGQESVRIVHGIGSGALRRAIQDHLATSPYCAGFRGGESNEGGAGVTVATLH